MGLFNFLASICNFERNPRGGNAEPSQSQSRNEERHEKQHEEFILISNPPNDFPITNLPIDIFRIIKEFLIDKEYHQLLNICKHPQLRAAKAQYLCYNLPAKESWRYYLNQDHFYERISSNLHDKSKQLALTLSDIPSRPHPTIPDISSLGNLRCLTLRNVIIDSTLLGEIRFVKKLSLENFPFVVFLPKLDSNIQEIVIKEFPLLVDITNLADFPKVSLIFCPMLEDITPVKDCPDLTIKSCGRLENISCLSGQKKLSLSYCHRINDQISNLNSVKSLIIRECFAIKDLSGLTSVEELNINLTNAILPTTCHSKKVTFFNTSFAFNSFSSMLQCELLTIERFSHVNFKGFPKFSPTSLREIRCSACSFSTFSPLPLQNLYKLELDSCSGITSFDALGHIPVFIMKGCWGKYNLEGLGKPTQKHVILERLYDAIGFQALQYVKRVEIITCDKFFSINDLKYCEDIVIEDCRSFSHSGTDQDLSPNCRSVRIIDCPGFYSTESLRNVPNLEVRGCSQIHDLIIRQKVTSH